MNIIYFFFGILSTYIYVHGTNIVLRLLPATALLTAMFLVQAYTLKEHYIPQIRKGFKSLKTAVSLSALGFIRFFKSHKPIVVKNTITKNTTHSKSGVSSNNTTTNSNSVPGISYFSQEEWFLCFTNIQNIMLQMSLMQKNIDSNQRTIESMIEVLLKDSKDTAVSSAYNNIHNTQSQQFNRNRKSGSG